MIIENKVITLKDIAEKLGISINAVSRALRDKSDISKETIIKVKQTAKEMGYIGNNLAKTIRKGRSNVVGIVISSLTNPYYILSVTELIGRLRSFGLSSSLIVADNTVLDETTVSDLIYECVCGIITFSKITEKSIALCKKFSMPLLAVGFDPNDDEVSSVSCNEELTGQLVADLVIKEGRKKPCYVNCRLDNNILRRSGFIESLKAKGIHVDDYFLEYSANDQEKEETINKIIANGNDFIYCFNDEIASIVLELIDRYKVKGCHVVGVDAATKQIPMLRKIDSVGIPFSKLIDYVEDNFVKYLESGMYEIKKIVYEPEIIFAAKHK